MERLLAGLFVFGVVIHLLGLGAAFAPLVVSTLTLIFILGGIILILNLRKPGEVLGNLIMCALAVTVLAPLFAGIIKALFGSVSWTTEALLVVGLLAVAIFSSRGKE